MYHICCCCCYQTGTGKTNRTEKEKVSNKIYGKFSSGQCCMFQRKFIKVAKKIYFVLCVIQMRGTQRGRWDKKRWRRRERKETSVLCSELAKAEMSNLVRTYSSIISDKHVTNFKTNTLKNLNQIFCSLQWARQSRNEQPRHNTMLKMNN